MMKIRKIVSLFIVMIMTLSLVACGDEVDDNTASTTNQEISVEESVISSEQISENYSSEENTTNAEEKSNEVNSENDTGKEVVTKEDITTKVETTKKETTKKETTKNETTKKETTKGNATENTTKSLEKETNDERYAMIEFEREGKDFDIIDKVYMAMKKIYAKKDAYNSACEIYQLSKGISLSELLKIKDNSFVQKLSNELGTTDLDSRLSSKATEKGRIFVVARDGEVGVWIGSASFVNKTKYWDPTDENFEMGEISFSEVSKKRTVYINIWIPQESLKSVLDKFEKKHSELTIIWNYTIDSKAPMVDRIASERPDVYSYNSDILNTLVGKGLLLDYNSIAKEYIINNNSSQITKAVTYNDKIYGMPYALNGWVLFYDKSVFKGVDISSLDEMLKVGSVAYDIGSSWFTQGFFTAAGCSFSKQNFDFAGVKAEKTLQYVVENYNNGKLIDINAYREEFKKGNIPARLDGVWYMNEISKVYGDNLGIAVPPQIDIGYGDGQLKVMNSLFAMGINPNAKNRDVLIELVKYITNEENQDIMYTNAIDFVPCNSNLLKQKKYINDELVVAYNDTFNKYSYLTPSYITNENWWNYAQELCRKILNREITDYKEEIKKFNESINN